GGRSENAAVPRAAETAQDCESAIPRPRKVRTEASHGAGVACLSHPRKYCPSIGRSGATRQHGQGKLATCPTVRQARSRKAAPTTFQAVRSATTGPAAALISGN